MQLTSKKLEEIERALLDGDISELEPDDVIEDLIADLREARRLLSRLAAYNPHCQTDGVDDVECHWCQVGDKKHSSLCEYAEARAYLQSLEEKR